MVFAIIATQKWQCNCMDIKTAFLQGRNFNRLVYLTPPSEAKTDKNLVWKLNKCVYGLNDASRVWYLTVRDQLLNSGARVSKYDEAIFTWYFDGQLQGIMCTHVDDFLWAGTSLFELRVIDKIRKDFIVKSEESRVFKYLGLDIIQNHSGISIKQDDFVKTLSLLDSGTAYDIESQMSEMQTTQCRSLIGKINWLATQTRPDLSYEVSDLSSQLKSGKVEVIKSINKVIRKAKKEASIINIPSLADATKISLVGYSDASFANLSDGGSQGGYIIFAIGSNGMHVPIAWQSRRVRRLVKSTQAAETLATVDAAEACIYYRMFLIDLLNLKDVAETMPITCKTDNSGVYSSVYSSTQILDKRLRIEMAILRELLEKREINTLQWVPTDYQIADSLTKGGVPSSKVLEHTSSSGTCIA